MRRCYFVRVRKINKAAAGLALFFSIVSPSCSPVCALPESMLLLFGGIEARISVVLDVIYLGGCNLEMRPPAIHNEPAP
jgi:hypothetical protein